MLKVIAIRHGQTEGNREKSYRGRWDLPLDPLGRQQAELAAKALAGLEPEAVFCSPLLRARQTAEAIAAPYGLQVQDEPDLIDIDYGLWTRRTDSEVAAAEPELYRLWREHPEKMTFPGGENLLAVRNRVQNLLKRLSSRSGTLFLCGHRVSIKMLVMVALGLPDAAFWQIKIDTASITTLELEEGRWRLMLLNDVCHLKTLSTGEPPDF